MTKAPERGKFAIDMSATTMNETEATADSVETAELISLIPRSADIRSEVNDREEQTEGVTDEDLAFSILQNRHEFSRQRDLLWSERTKRLEKIAALQAEKSR